MSAVGWIGVALYAAGLLLRELGAPEPFGKVLVVAGLTMVILFVGFRLAG